jgi:hypothetical protein
LRYLCFLCFLAAFQGSISAQNASFFKEHITFKIEAGCFYVNGEYNVRRTGDTAGEISLFYPFPVDTLFAPVDSFLIYDVTHNTEIVAFKKTMSGAFFRIGLDTVTTVLISYQQKLLSNQAQYILTTTQHWGKPLEEVSYELITPADMKIISFSYMPDNRQEVGDAIIYYWRKYHFMPDRDMIFTFEESSSVVKSNDR